MSPRAGIAKSLYAVLAVILVTSCAKLLDPMAAAPGASATGRSAPLSTGEAEAVEGQLFYPLDIGNRWSYDNTFSVQILPDLGAAESPNQFHNTIDVDLTRIQPFNGRDYVVQREAYHSDDFDTSNEFLYRQDFSGLFNADWNPSDEIADEMRPTEGVSASHGPEDVGFAMDQRLSPSDRRVVLGALEKLQRIRQIAIHGAPGKGRGRGTPGPLEGEIALLSYPLHAGSQWHVREDPLVVYTVEGDESIELPAGRFPAWRIRIEWPGVFGPNDSVLVWYGRDGFLRLVAHLEGVATDENGNPYGRVVSDTDQVLTGLSLVGHPGS